jgi:hypothetical protein
MFSFVPALMRAILFAWTAGANEKHLLTFGSTRRLGVNVLLAGDSLRSNC